MMVGALLMSDHHSLGVLDQFGQRLANAPFVCLQSPVVVHGMQRIATIAVSYRKILPSRQAQEAAIGQEGLESASGD